MDDMPKIICISGKAEHGKTTFRNMISHMMDYNDIPHINISYGNYVKFVAKEIFGWNGIKDEKGRSLLQWVGTDWAKARDRDYWVKCAMRDVGMFYGAIGAKYVLIDDCRFEEEIKSWSDSGYNVTTVRVNRLDHKSALTEEQLKHRSETSLDDYSFDFTLVARNYDELERIANQIFTKNWG